MALHHSYSNFSLILLALCALATLYTWVLSLYSFRQTSHELIQRSARRVKRILIGSFLLVLIASVVEIASIFPHLSAASIGTKSTVLENELSRLLLLETHGMLFATMMGLFVLRVRVKLLRD